MKYTITYQKDNKIISKILDIPQYSSLDEELSKFENIINLKEHWRRVDYKLFQNRKKELFLFFKQLNLMLQSHLSFNEALELILETNLDKEIKTIILILQNAVIQDYPIDVALSEYQNIIGKMPIMFLKQGIENGTMKSSLESIVTLLEQEIQINSKLSEKLRYPFFLVLSLIASLSIIFIYVVPSFEFIFNSLKDALPLSTKALLLVNKLLISYWHIAVLLVISFTMIILFILKKHKFYFDRLIFYLPVIGRVISSYQLYKLFLSLVISIESKYQFQIAIDNSIGTITNLYLQDILKKIQTGIKSGENIADLFSRYLVFDQMVVKLLYTAENTGKYEIVLKDITNYYKESFELKLKKLTSVLEPLIISIIALVVLWLILAIMVPIWQLSSIL